MKTRAGPLRQFAIRQPRTIIGSDPQCCLRFALPSVARQHCELVLSDSCLCVAPLTSTRSTLINDRQIQAATHAHNGDRITIGSVTLTLINVPEHVEHGSSEIHIAAAMNTANLKGPASSHRSSPEAD